MDLRDSPTSDYHHRSWPSQSSRGPHELIHLQFASHHSIHLSNWYRVHLPLGKWRRRFRQFSPMRAFHALVSSFRSPSTKMFYFHQLIARRAPFGQIWMAATLLAKNNGKRLNKLNIIRICEEILNPSVPMALRLFGILMDDVTRLLVEISEAWKLKTVAAGPTILPIGKTPAKYEAVTLKDNGDTDVGDSEQSLHFSTTTAFRAASFFPKMYYSHQLLAKKGPLSQIWMAATLHAKINCKRHNKPSISSDPLQIVWCFNFFKRILISSSFGFNFSSFSEEILNPTVPGILKGAV